MDLDPQKDALEYEKVFDHLINNFYIQQDGIQISITFKGIFYYEEKYLEPDYYYLKIIKIILEFFEKLENGEFANYSIPIFTIVAELRKEGINMNEKELYHFLVILDDKIDLFKNVGPFGISTEDKIETYSNKKVVLTPSGREFLKNWRLQRELFMKIKNQLQKDLLIKEYDGLQKIIQQNLWKDACIKMGSILEYLLTLWLQNKGITPSQVTNKSNIKRWKYVKFYKMIEFYMNHSKKYSEEIGTYTDWNLIKNILKDYRNYIHLLKYEKRIKKGDFLRKKEFDRIYPIFSEIIKKF